MCYSMSMAKRARSTMNVSITPRQKRFVERAVRSGSYQSASEVVREGLRTLEQHHAQVRALNKKLEQGVRDIDAGRVHSADDVLAEWRRRDALAAGRSARRRKSA